MAFRLPPIFVPIKGVDEFSNVMNSAAGKIKKLSSPMKQVGKIATVGLTLPVLAFGASTVKTAGNFQQSMNKVGIVARASDKQLTAMTQQARKLGATTKFSASQAADGMSFLAMAGFDANQIMSAMPAVLDLAAAGGMDLAQAADIASNILTGYGLEASKIGDVNDIMTATFTSTDTNLVHLGEAMKHVAPVAGAMKVNIAETSAALGLLGNAGIQASMAGTTLRDILSKISQPSAEAVETLQKLGIRKEQVLTSEGNVRSIVDVVKAFEESGATASDMLTIFGDRAGPGMAALVKQGSAALSGLTKALEDAAGKGGTAALAEAQMKGFNDAIKELRSAFEDLQLSIADSGLLDFVTGLLRKFTALLSTISKTNPGLLRFATTLAIVAAAIGPILTMLGTMGTLLDGISKMESLGPGMGKGLNKMLGPLGLAVTAFIVWSDVIKQISDNWDDIKSTFSDIKLLGKTMKFFFADLFGGAAPTGAASVAGAVGAKTSRSVVDVNIKSDRPGVRAVVSRGDVNLMTEMGLLPVE